MGELRTDDAATYSMVTREQLALGRSGSDHRLLSWDKGSRPIMGIHWCRVAIPPETITKVGEVAVTPATKSAIAFPVVVGAEVEKPTSP